MAPETGKQRQPPPAVRMRAVGDNDQTTADVETGIPSRSGGGGTTKIGSAANSASSISQRRQRNTPAESDRRIDDELRRRLWRQDAFVIAIGLLLLAAAAALTCLYWNYARPFPSTDDAFIAALHPVSASRYRGA